MSKQRSMLLFEQAIKSDVTKKAYMYQIAKFQSWAKVKNADGLLQAPQKDIQILLEDYVMYLKKTISPNSIPIYFAPIELFYVMNDVNLNFKKIRKLFPEKVKKGNERGYTHDEIRIIVNSAKTRRHKALVLLLSSSGCRIGAIPDIRLKHMQKIKESYSIKIYEGEKEEDYIFTTPEATEAIDSYLDERRKDKEYVDDETPLFRVTYRLGIEKVKPCSVDNLTHIMGRLITVIDRKKNDKTKRFDIPKNHGFRKFFATVIKNTLNIPPTMTEKLINHIGIVQMDGAYFTPSVEKMYESYEKAIPDLTIDQSEKQKNKIKSLEDEKNDKIQNLEKTIQNMQSNMEKRDNEWNDTIVKLFEEQAKKFTDPNYIKQLQKKEKS